MSTTDYDVLIIGGGLAGQSLARQLLLYSDKRVLLVDKRNLPPTRQKVGEATVQASGYYYSRVLQMEEHLLCEHYMKYNLRFYWPGADAARYEGYSQSFIRDLSNIVTYQLDRNKFEGALLKANRENPRFTCEAPVSELDVDLAQDGGPHRYRYRTQDGERVEGRADWVVDAAGRARFLARKLGLLRRSPIRHGTTFAWVDGLVDIEKLTSLSAREVRLRPDRCRQGHVPAFLATNHFCGEGFWFWVIPLHGKTSLGLVYDRARIPYSEVATPDKMIDWVCRRFPLFERDLRGRAVVGEGGLADFAHDAEKTLSADRWAMVGEACRFTDPLYSPGGDLISTYNTLVTDAILTEDRELLPGKVRLYEQLARSIYDAYVPSFAVSYDTLGDQEAFSLRYTWELTVYFAYYVFPMINDLFTDATFSTGYLRRFARLGPINRALHHLLAAYYHWKKAHAPQPEGETILLDFTESGHLRAARECFFKVGLSSEEGRRVLDEQLESLEEVARWIVSHVAHVVTGDRRALSSEYVQALDLGRVVFDPQAFAQALAAIPQDAPAQAWKTPPTCLARFGTAARAAAARATRPPAERSEPAEVPA